MKVGYPLLEKSQVVLVNALLFMLRVTPISNIMILEHTRCKETGKFLNLRGLCEPCCSRAEDYFTGSNLPVAEGTTF